jgi:hypothetical protein
MPRIRLGDLEDRVVFFVFYVVHPIADQVFNQHVRPVGKSTMIPVHMRPRIEVCRNLMNTYSLHSMLISKVVPSEPNPSESSIMLTDDSELKFRSTSKRNQTLASAPAILNEKHVSKWVNYTTRESRIKRTFSAASIQDMRADNEDESEELGLDIPAARIVARKIPRNL